MRPSSFHFYAADFLAATSDMSNEEVGAYIRLLCVQWGKGGLPNNPDRLSRMAGAMPWPSLGHVISKFQVCEDGYLRNERLEGERQKQANYRESQALKGKQGAIQRWGNGRCHDPAMPVPMPKDSSPSPSPIFNLQSPDSTVLSPPGGEEKNSKIELMNEARIVLGHLNDSTGRTGAARFRDGECLKTIGARLMEVDRDITGVKAMIDRQVKRWAGTEQVEYLRPSTLFRKGNLSEYFANKDQLIETGSTKRKNIDSNQLQEDINVTVWKSQTTEAKQDTKL